MNTENPHEVLLVVSIVTLCFGFEAACSKNKDDINLMDFLVFCFSYFDHQIGSGIALQKRHGCAV